MNLFDISSAIMFFSSLGFGLYVYSRNRQSKLNQSWLAFSASVAIWSLSLYGVTSSSTGGQAMTWQYFLDVAGIFVPILYFYFISNLLGLKNKICKWFALSAGVLLTALSFTSLFKIGMANKFGFFWINPGSLYFLFPLFFVFLILCSIFQLVRNYRQTTDNNLKQQIKYQLLGAAIGFSGGVTNFLPQLFDIYPFGNYFITLYVFFIGYSAIHNRLFNIRTVAAELFTGGTILALLFNLLSPKESVTDWITSLVIFVIVLIFGVLIVRSIYREVLQREKIEKLAIELEKANERLKELDALKTEFISFATHQLRVPITAIKGYTSEILQGDFGPVPDNLKPPTEVIMQSSSSLAVLVDDYLNVSRIEQGKMNYEFSDFNLADLVNEVANEQRPSVEKKGLKLEVKVDGGAMIHADRGKIKQVLLNLLDNSMKYTPAGTIIIALNKQDGKARLSIKDTGAGIKPETMVHLFQKFSRASDASKYNLFGTGLGLYLASELLKAHHGKIWVESEGDGKGSTFFVELSMV